MVESYNVSNTITDKGKILYLVIMMLLSASSLPLDAQDASRNYVACWEFVGDNGTDSILNVEYFDGLGRSVEKRGIGITPAGNDLSVVTTYDAQNRIAKTWNSIPTSALSTISDVCSSGCAFYSDPRPFTENTYESKPGGRILNQYLSGSQWYSNNKYIKTRYSTNSAGQICRYRLSGSSVIRDTYSAGTLEGQSTVNEDNQLQVIYTDIHGNKISELSFLDGHFLYTDYIYDERNNLVAVLPPAATEELHGRSSFLLTDDIIAKYGYVYQYDNCNRCVYKKIPGVEPIKYRYDKAGRIIFSQDGNQRMNHEWTFYLYDKYGRHVVSGVIPVASELSEPPTVSNGVVIATASQSSEIGGYSVSGVSLIFPTILSTTYYDRYTLPLWLPDSVTSLIQTNAANNVTGKGRVTARVETVGDDPAAYQLTVYQYDDLGNLVREQRTNVKGGKEDYVYTYTFNRKIRTKTHTHTASRNALVLITEHYSYFYDNGDRLQEVRYQYNNLPEITLIENTYDEACRLISTNIGSVNGAPADTQSREYNVRGWLHALTSSSGFEQRLCYNADNGPLHVLFRQYSGNIGAISWKNPGSDVTQLYHCDYDALSRLTNAYYMSDSEDGRNNTELFVYDVMGNITHIWREGLYNQRTGEYDLIDNATIHYDGNLMTSIDDAVTTGPTYLGAQHIPITCDYDAASEGPAFTYDSNGNMTSDVYQKVSITYNRSNLPVSIDKTDDMFWWAHNEYAADGTLLRSTKSNYRWTSPTPNLPIHPMSSNSDGISSVGENTPSSDTFTPFPGVSPFVYVTTVTDYCDNFIYINGTLSRVLTDAGYITFSTDGTPVHHFYVKDHEGNNRIVLKEGGTVEEVNDYYPSGTSFGTMPTLQPYKYSGKEFALNTGLSAYNFGARWYSPIYGRFLHPDPLAEKYFSISPYAFCANNPLNAVDADGRLVIFINGFQLNPIETSKQYWGGFDKRVLAHFRDNSVPIYKDGSLGSYLGYPGMTSNIICSNRYLFGNIDGIYDASKIIARLKRDKNNRIVEPLRIVSHSMGGAYAKGYAQAIIDYVNAHKERCEGLTFSEYDFAPFQSAQQMAIEGVDTYQYSHQKDKIAHDAPIKGAHFMQTCNDEDHRHPISNYIQYVNSLPEGTCTYQNGGFVKKQMK